MAVQIIILHPVQQIIYQELTQQITRGIKLLARLKWETTKIEYQNRKTICISLMN